MNQQQIQLRYEELCNTPSDINKHLPILKMYADKCDHVTEMGVRGAVSLYSLLTSSAKKVVAIDIVEAYRPPEIDKLKFICGDTLEIEIEETDMLFIDTYHVYRQLVAELKRHAPKVKKFIAFHDTFTFGENGEDGSRPGLTQAINEFLEENRFWKLAYRTNDNNGLTIIQRL